MPEENLVIAFRKHKLVFVGILIILVSSFLDTASGWVSESRMVRDLLGTTPFHSVEIDRTVVVGDELWIWGTLEKRRGEKVAHYAYTRYEDGPNILALFRSEEEPNAPQNRPPTNNPQAFGPWVITTSIKDPDFASFWTVHEFENGESSQANRFFSIPWETTPADQGQGESQ